MDRVLRPITSRVYLFSFLDEFIPLYPVYVLIFQDTGLSSGQIASLFAIWTVTSFLAEVPSGVIADKLPRHFVVAVAILLRAIGFASWLLFPSFLGFAVGFVLWGVSTALTSGTWQALVYEELQYRRRAGAYTVVMARSATIRNLAVVAGLLLAPVLLRLGGYGWAGWASVLVCLVAVPVLITFPHQGQQRTPHNDPVAEHPVSTFRTGLAEVRTSRVLARALLISGALMAVVNFDEYMPLQARATGVSTEIVPLLMLVPWVSMALGGLAVSWWPRVEARTVAIVLGVSTVFLAVGSYSELPIGFVGIGIFYALYRFASVLADARVQESISGGNRATIGSVAGFASQVFTLGFFAYFGIGGYWLSVPQLMAVAAIPMVGLALLIPRWLPSAAPVHGSVGDC